VIFVTVGDQMPFDRLIRAVDGWAISRGRSDVFAQTGATKYQTQFIRSVQFLDPLEFRKYVETANVIVAHAGMGSIITALEFGKPIIVMPRRAEFKETRNDHQVACALHFGQHGRVVVALDELQLPKALDQAASLQAINQIEMCATPQLISTIQCFIEETFNTSDYPTNAE
jgi:UDP-N-acetylglucosamine transferase subunit ALG13